MRIYVNKAGIFGMYRKYALNSDSSFNKINPINPISSDTPSVARDSQKAFVAESNPPYIIDISSQGKVAVNSLKNLDDILDKRREQISDSTVSKDLLADRFESTVTNRSESNVTEAGYVVKDSSESESEIPFSDDELSTTSARTQNLSRFTEYQLQNMVDDGTITRNEMNDELEKRSSAEISAQRQGSSAVRNAIEAYSFQMNYTENYLLY